MYAKLSPETSCLRHVSTITECIDVVHETRYLYITQMDLKLNLLEISLYVEFLLRYVTIYW